MEFEMEMVDQMAAEEATAAERLLAAAARLEAAAERLGAQEIAAAAELEQKLREAEAQIVQLKAAGAGGRRTLAPGTMMAREGTPVESGALDAALNGLSVEQRIAVKAQMLRGGLLG